MERHPDENYSGRNQKSDRIKRHKEKKHSRVRQNNAGKEKILWQVNQIMVGLSQRDRVEKYCNITTDKDNSQQKRENEKVNKFCLNLIENSLIDPEGTCWPIWPEWYHWLCLVFGHISASRRSSKCEF